MYVGAWLSDWNVGFLFVGKVRKVTKTLMAIIRDLIYADVLETHTKAELQILMDCFSDACDEFRLTFNPPKNTVMLQPTPGELYIPPSNYVMGKCWKS